MRFHFRWRVQHLQMVVCNQSNTYIDTSRDTNIILRFWWMPWSLHLNENWQQLPLNNSLLGAIVGRPLHWKNYRCYLLPPQHTDNIIMAANPSSIIAFTNRFWLKYSKFLSCQNYCKLIISAARKVKKLK